MKPTNKSTQDKYEIKEHQSIDLLKELHILTRDGKMNQDSRRKLKQVYHLVQFIEPIITELFATKESVQLIDFGSGKSYLGFILYDLIGKLQSKPLEIIGIELRKDLVDYCQTLALKLQFNNMAFHLLSTDEAIQSTDLPPTVDIVTALHACNTATDDAIRFALAKHVEHLVLVPCCQAEVASFLRKKKSIEGEDSYLAQIWRHPIHSREFGSHITNVLRTLQLESHGYQVTVTELVGWEHSMKNELIIASKGLNSKQQNKAREDLNTLLNKLQLHELVTRFN
ncbi:class I SAM-dependent methyltransferase [Polynucleobacter kasalickyi]|uniref:Methyltransferase domain-containing protein n=1 Tax=Polynucleobacter kasalickyi TaxID=1938817 RepID=A0A1W1ZUI9_9BURK|nr:SAM-dependent methyltransferase [Polynucleobacter kasalickyi]SMC52145.1 Methyltransferase domain-containing protein [Polynucleobacter kasalickyi]